MTRNRKQVKKTEISTDNIERRNDSLKYWLGFLGVIIAALIGLYATRLQVYVPIWTTQTAQAQMLAQTYVSIQSTLTPTVTATISFTPTSAGALFLTPVPTAIPVQENVMFIIPKPEEINGLPSLFNNYSDKTVPTTITYSLDVYHNRSYSWKYQWCATNESNLNNTLAQISYKFLIDEVIIPDSNFFVYKNDALNGWKCQSWATILTNWRQGNEITLSILSTIARPVFDGAKYYQPGDYRDDLIVHVQ